jgi:hypothetical protein
MATLALTYLSSSMPPKTHKDNNKWAFFYLNRYSLLEFFRGATCGQVEPQVVIPAFAFNPPILRIQSSGSTSHPSPKELGLSRRNPAMHGI